MSASRKATNSDVLRHIKFSDGATRLRPRGERRLAARAMARRSKQTLRDTWPLLRGPIAADEVSWLRGVVTQPARFRHLAVQATRSFLRRFPAPHGLLIHPTKGWRRKADGLPFGKTA